MALHGARHRRLGTTSVGARRAGRDLLAFVGSSAFLIGLLAATAAAIFPTMLKSSGDPARSLTAFNAAAGSGSLARGLYWWPPGLLLVLVYFTFLFSHHRGRITLADAVDGY